MATQDRRKEARRPFTLPVRVAGHDPDGTGWAEMTQSEDASFSGVSFPLKHQAFVGQALFLSLPLPKGFRQYALTDASYRVYAIVRDVAEGSPNRVGIMFLGKHPPRGYQANPGGRYLMPTDPPPAPKERRSSKRAEVFVNLKLQRNDGTEQTEQTVTENLSKGGVRVMTSLPLSKGDVLVLEDSAGSFQLRAEIRSVYIGKDGIPRLNLRFVDGPAPDQLLNAAGLSASEL